MLSRSPRFRRFHRPLALLAAAMLSCFGYQPAESAGLAPTSPILFAAAPASPALAPIRSALWWDTPVNHLARVPGITEAGSVTAITRSPDGSHSAYVLDGRTLWQADADGAHPRLLYALPADSFGQIIAPRYTADGRDLGFSAGCCANFTTYELSVDGAHPRRLFGGGIRLLQDWSPDGKHLLFTLNGALWVADPAGGHARPLGGDAPGAGSFADARYSPDGSHIVATLHPAQGAEEAAGAVIVLLHPDGQYLTILTPNLGLDASQPAWSPDGKQIAILVASGALGPLGRLHDLWLMRYDGKGLRNLTGGVAGDVSAIAWGR
ncbi:MAG TPA: hypothetical protein VNL71_14245 [Chloroflexota bacterium]|nr:hypothetical protein [Chloroflexota bacterium]